VFECWSPRFSVFECWSPRFSVFGSLKAVLQQDGDPNACLHQSTSAIGSALKQRLARIGGMTNP
jgi:hypothetical protein